MDLYLSLFPLWKATQVTIPFVVSAKLDHPLLMSILNSLRVAHARMVIMHGSLLHI